MKSMHLSINLALSLSLLIGLIGTVNASSSPPPPTQNVTFCLINNTFRSGAGEMTVSLYQSGSVTLPTNPLVKNGTVSNTYPSASCYGTGTVPVSPNSFSVGDVYFNGGNKVTCPNITISSPNAKITVTGTYKYISSIITSTGILYSGLTIKCDVSVQ